jgi:hypothetical protein
VKKVEQPPPVPENHPLPQSKAGAKGKKNLYSFKEEYELVKGGQN